MHFANKHLPFSLLSSTFLFCFHCSFFSGISALLRGLPNSKATCRCHRRRTAKIFFWQKQKYFLRDLLQYIRLKFGPATALPQGFFFKFLCQCMPRVRRFLSPAFSPLSLPLWLLKQSPSVGTSIVAHQSVVLPCN